MQSGSTFDHRISFHVDCKVRNNLRIRVILSLTWSYWPKIVEIYESGEPTEVRKRCRGNKTDTVAEQRHRVAISD